MQIVYKFEKIYRTQTLCLRCHKISNFNHYSLVLFLYVYFRIQNLLLNLILQFNCTDLYNQVPKLMDSKMLYSIFTKESEEINKVFILCIARSFIVTG